MMLQVTTFITLVVVAFAFRQEITFYQHGNAAGDGVILRGKYDILLPWQREFILNSSSFCYVGLFRGYANPSFVWTTFDPVASTTMRCENTTSFGPGIQSLRYAGPEDTATESLSIYGFSSFYEGTEVVITSDSAANWGFFPEFLMITGFSNWTLYYNDDFTGESTCVRGTSDFHPISIPNIPTFRSVVKGCDLSD